MMSTVTVTASLVGHGDDRRRFFFFVMQMVGEGGRRRHQLIAEDSLENITCYSLPPTLTARLLIGSDRDTRALIFGPRFDIYLFDLALAMTAAFSVRAASNPIK